LSLLNGAGHQTSVEMEKRFMLVVWKVIFSNMFSSPLPGLSIFC
jgi:hypothetical protein